VAAHVLVGWRGVLGPDGEPVAYGPEAALRLPIAARRRLVERAHSPELWPGEDT